MVAIYLRALLLALGLVSSIGLQNLFVFNNALSNKTGRALLYALFVWIADATLTVAAFLGMGALIMTHPLFKTIVMFGGGLLIVWIGFMTVRSATSIEMAKEGQSSTAGKIFAQSWVVSWANPQALIDTGLMLGALRGTLTAVQVPVFLMGLLSASAIWFFGITILLNLLRNKISKRVFVWINIASGVIVCCYGVMLLVQAAMLIF